MSKKLPNLLKAEDPAGYAKLANEGLMIGFPVKINGQTHREDNGIGYHSTIKFFNTERDHAHAIHELAQHLPLNPPDAKNTQIEPGELKDRNGNTVYVLKLKGNSAEKIKEHNGKFAHMGDPQPYEYVPHISIPKSIHDKVKASGAKTAHEAGIEFGSAQLKKGPKVLKTYHHQPDTTDPKVPDEGDMTARVSAPKTEKSEEIHGKKPLMKPYVSEAQRRWAHTSSGKEALGGEAGVHEWDEATKGKKLPEKVGKIEKGVLQNAGVALGMAGALAGASPASAAHKTPAHVPATNNHHVVPKAVHHKPYDHKKMLHAIAMVESGNNPKVQHKTPMGGMHHGAHAIGRYGLTEPTIKDTINKFKDLKQKHAKALALTGQHLHNYITDNKGLEDIIADRHLAHLEHRLGQKPEHLGYAWLNGAQKTLTDRNSGKDIKNHWHAKKVRAAYDKGK